MSTKKALSNDGLTIAWQRFDAILPRNLVHRDGEAVPDVENRKALSLAPARALNYKMWLHALKELPKQ